MEKGVDSDLYLKSSIIQLLQGFYEPVKGSIILGQQSIENYTNKELRRYVGVVNQKTAIFQGSIRHNITLGDKNFTEVAIWQACEQAQIAEEIRKLPGQLDTLLSDYGLSLSGGQMQRISIARVLLRQSQIIVFDEATSALDGISEHALQSVIRAMKSHRTIITIAHSFAAILDADRIMVIDQGRVADTGTIPELLERCTIFQELYGEQSRWNTDNGAVPKFTAK